MVHLMQRQGIVNRHIGLGRSGQVRTSLLGQGNDIQNPHHGAQYGDTLSQTVRNCFIQQGLLGFFHNGPLFPNQKLRPDVAAFLNQRTKLLNQLRHRKGALRMLTQQPRNGIVRKTGCIKKHFVLGGGGNLVVQGLDVMPEGSQLERLPHDGIGPNNVTQFTSHRLLHGKGKMGPHTIDHAVGRKGGDDVFFQGMGFHILRKPLAQARGKIEGHILQHALFFQKIGALQVFFQGNFAVGQQNRQLGPHKTQPLLQPRIQRGLGGQALQRGVELSPFLKMTHEFF